jgi:signal peptidase I
MHREPTPPLSTPDHKPDIDTRAPAGETPDPVSRPFRSLFRTMVQTAALVLVLYVALRIFLVPYQVDGASMSPDLRDGERVFVHRLAYTHFDSDALWNVLPWEHRAGHDEIFPPSQPERGDIIVLRPPFASNEPYIKRVIGLPGERVTFREGLVFINGQALTESYIDGAITSCIHGPWCSLVVPEDAVFVLGDNRQDSTDSRSFGTVTYDHIIGQAVFSNWPVETIGPVEHPDYDLTAPPPA